MKWRGIKTNKTRWINEHWRNGRTWWTERGNETDEHDERKGNTRKGIGKERKTKTTTATISSTTPKANDANAAEQNQEARWKSKTMRDRTTMRIGKTIAKKRKKKKNTKAKE
jgi:hypothetical protein